ncbi:hypothetical protein HPB47_017686 [Ixodes persulcatus]|uniref:Uncharacterized protein n=1 Tax=Ixodes persulcatus TaxID=34615 RepID=A0AC60QR87_IXOPE|nr:hypothetical protein HPB47_017686 [Ixodes persulcatus]
MTEPEVAEEVAIALALKLQDAKIVVSDSQMAIRQYAKGRISPVTLRVLGDPEKTAKVKLIWTPAHSSLPGNKEAHDAARGLTRRAGATSDHSIESLTRGDRRDALPSGLSLAGQKTSGSVAATTDRHLPQSCPAEPMVSGSLQGRLPAMRCKSDSSPHSQPLLKQIPNQESWEALLLCTDLKVQEQVVRLAEDAAGVQGTLAVA